MKKLPQKVPSFFFIHPLFGNVNRPSHSVSQFVLSSASSAGRMFLFKGSPCSKQPGGDKSDGSAEASCATVNVLFALRTTFKVHRVKLKTASHICGHFVPGSVLPVDRQRVPSFDLTPLLICIFYFFFLLH